MKTINLWKVVFVMCTMAMVIACGNDNDDPADNSDDGTELKGDYTATTNVKEANIGNQVYDNYSSHDDYLSNRGPVIYEDFNHLYQIALSQGNIMLLHYARVSGLWSPKVVYVSYSYKPYFDNTKHCLLLDNGRVANIHSITIKAVYESGNWTNSIQAQPNYGYIAFFTTENKEIKYLRIYIKDYKLDAKGSLSDITVQYQLY